MALKNIYFSGPDAAGKTTLACRLRDFLKGQNLEAEVIRLPSRGGVLSGCIDLCRQGRVDMPPVALDLMFIADRLDTAGWCLVKDRERRPGVIYIFDRGPADGAVYGAARAPEGYSLDYMRWIEGCDRKFLEKFPVDLGFLLVPSLEDSKRRMLERSISRSPDGWDRDAGLQVRVRKLFDIYTEGKPRWKKIMVDSVGPNIVGAEALIRNIVRTRLRKENLGVEGQPTHIEGHFRP